MDDHTHIGVLVNFDNITTFSKPSLLTKGTLFLTSFEIIVLSINCLAFIDFQYDTNIVCVGQDDQFYLHQHITDKKAIMVSNENTKQSPLKLFCQYSNTRAVRKLILVGEVIPQNDCCNRKSRQMRKLISSKHLS